MKADCYLLVKFLKLTVLNLTNVGRREVESIVQILYREGNIDIVSYHEHFEGANHCSVGLL